MKFKFKYANKIVFLFITFGLGVFLLFTTLLLSQSDVFKKKIYYRTILGNAKGLQKKPPIFLSGLEIGRIDDFDFNAETNAIDVTFYIYEKYKKQVIQNAVISRTINPFSGEVSEFELLPPESKKYPELEQNGLVPFIGSEAGKKLILDGVIKQRGDDISSIINSINNILLSLQKKNNKDDGSIFHTLDNLTKLTDKFISLTETFENEQVVENINQSIKQTHTLLNSFPKTLSLFNSNLKQMDSLIVNFQTPTKVIDGLGGSSYRNVILHLDSTTYFMKEMVKELHDQRESIRLLLHSSQESVNRLNKTLQGVNNNPLIRGGIDEQNVINEVEIED